MYETSVKVLSGVKFEVNARSHKAVCDQPVEAGGTDAGMTPPELFLASIATCAAYYAVQYLKVRNLSTEDVNIRVTADKAMNPPRIGSIRIEVDSAFADDERHRDGLRRAVEKCLIHNTLLHPPTIEIAVQTQHATV